MQLPFYWQLSRFHRKNVTSFPYYQFPKRFASEYTDRRTFFLSVCLFIKTHSETSCKTYQDRFVRCFSGEARRLCPHPYFRFHEPVTPVGCAGVFCRRRRRSPWHFGKCSSAMQTQKANTLRFHCQPFTGANNAFYYIHSLQASCICVWIWNEPLALQRSVLTLGLVADRQTQSRIVPQRAQLSLILRLPHANATAACLISQSARPVWWIQSAHESSKAAHRLVFVWALIWK